MNTSELYSCLHNMLKCHNVHFDVIPCDRLKNISYKKTTFLIVNTDDSTKPGEHWVGIVINKNAINFMCSYGVPMGAYGIHFENIARRLRRKILQRYKCIQSDNTNVCGQYALYYMYCKFKNQNFYCSFSNKK
jgi:hypothetical protein